jgi:hypothetical protein
VAKTKDIPPSHKNELIFACLALNPLKSAKENVLVVEVKLKNPSAYFIVWGGFSFLF